MKATIAVIALVVLAALVAAGTARPVAIPGRSAPAYATCQEEDGSTPGQAFPCYWNATRQGNGAGQSYLLAEPACSDSYEVPDHPSDQCDDLESLIGGAS